MPAQKLAFFGATGGCAGFCLAASLRAGYDCTALARTPDKLTAAMKAKGVSDEAIEQHLTIIRGDAKDVEAVKQTLVVPRNSSSGTLADTIVSGIGGTPVLQWSLRRPVILNDETICQGAGATLLRALTELQPAAVDAKKPLYINLSTTGIQTKGKPRDVPLLFVPLYMYALQSPHEDKAILMRALSEHMALPESQRVLRGYVNVKPSLLMDGEARGLKVVRQGTDDLPAVGYTIRRADVGMWIFENLVKDGANVKSEWLGTGVNLTY